MGELFGGDANRRQLVVTSTRWSHVGEPLRPTTLFRPSSMLLAGLPTHGGDFAASTEG